MDNVESLIKFIEELVNDEFDYCIDYIDAEYYFMHGGCLELAKILKKLIPEVEIVINDQLDHFAIKYHDNLYDATGKIKDQNSFCEISSSDIRTYEQYYGIPDIKFEHKSVDETIIDEIKEINCDYVKKLIHNIKNLTHSNS